MSDRITEAREALDEFEDKFGAATFGWTRRIRAAVRALVEPPTDDEREAEFNRIIDVLRFEIRISEKSAEQVAYKILAAGFRRQGPVTETWERKTENRIHYRYGVNSGIYSGHPYNQTATHAEQKSIYEGLTSGPIDVTKRESRTVLYGPWEVVPDGE